MSAGTWIVSRTASARFPYRITIEDAAGRVQLCLRAQDRWPAANQNIFCMRESDDATADGEEIERVPITVFQRRGVRTSVVLDRARYKRCDFLFVTRRYKNRPDETFEQIFWQTQTSMVQRRPKVAPAALRTRHALTVAIDSRERYPWRFAGSTVTRKRLESGDYALMRDGRPIAVVERKTLTNMLADFGVLPLLHQRLLEFSSHENNALVIEAPYEDFLNPAKVHHFSPAFCAAAIAELYVRFPRLRVVFCSNRKTANAWTASFFAAVQAAGGGGASSVSGHEAGQE